MTCVLLVDDAEMLTKALARYLSTRGHEVRVCNGGAEAIATLLEGVDVIVVDYAMPRVNGLDVIRALRERGEMHPAILCSGVAGKQLRAEAFEAGFDACVSKNSIEELAAAIEAASRRCVGAVAPAGRINGHSVSAPLALSAEAKGMTEPRSAQAPGSVEVVLLGDRMVVVGQSKPVRLPPLPYALLARVLSKRGCPVPRPDLAEFLWPAVTEPWPRHRRNLDQVVWRLRAALKSAAWLIDTADPVGITMLFQRIGPAEEGDAAVPRLQKNET